MRESRIIKRHARSLFRQNFAGLLRLSLLLAVPNLLPGAMGLVPVLADLRFLREGIGIILSLLFYPLQLGAVRLLLLTFEKDRLEGGVWRYYHQGHWGTISLLWLLFRAPIHLFQLVQPALETVQDGKPPQWLLLVLGTLYLVILAGYLWFICRFLLCQYLFFLDEDMPAKQLISQSLKRTAGYTGFILSFSIPLALLYSLCTMAVPFFLTIALPSGAAWWKLLPPVLGLPVWPYFCLSMAGLASVLLPDEKERRRAERKKWKTEGKTAGEK